MTKFLHEIPLKCTIRLNAPPKPIENRENSQLLNFNNFTYYNEIVAREKGSKEHEIGALGRAYI
jgi:hypothetical protein